MRGITVDDTVTAIRSFLAVGLAAAIGASVIGSTIIAGFVGGIDLAIAAVIIQRTGH